MSRSHIGGDDVSGGGVSHAILSALSEKHKQNKMPDFSFLHLYTIPLKQELSALRSRPCNVRRGQDSVGTADLRACIYTVGLLGLGHHLLSADYALHPTGSGVYRARLRTSHKCLRASNIFLLVADLCTLRTTHAENWAFEKKFQQLWTSSFPPG